MIIRIINKLLSKTDMNIVDASDIFQLDKDFREIFLKCRYYTMTSLERMYALYKATEYIVNMKIPGDAIECGVWKGGSAMVIAIALLKLGQRSRKIYLYDTFEGMSKPTSKDSRIYNNSSAYEKWKKSRCGKINKWCYSSLSEVKENLISTGYPTSNLVFVKGKVENTIPMMIPEKISLLRLDTDWYESTLHELRYLFPKLSQRGVLILDDYGHWKGARDAADEYFKEKRIRIFLNRIDNTGRIGIK